MIAQLLQQDERGMEALLLHYGPLMRYIIAPILPDPQDREECLSEVSMRVWSRIAQFDPARNKVVLRSTPTAEIRSKLTDISVIVSHVEEGLPTIISVTDVASGAVNTKLTPGGGLTGSGQRIKIAGETGDAVGFFFVKDGSQTSVAVPMTSVLRNDPSAFSLIIPALEDGTYYLEVATRSSGNSKVFLKEVRRNRFPYPLTVGGGDGDSESPDEV